MGERKKEENSLQRDIFEKTTVQGEQLFQT